MMDEGKGKTAKDINTQGHIDRQKKKVKGNQINSKITKQGQKI